MAKHSKKKAQTAPETPARPAADLWRRLAPTILVFVTLACYWTPMTSDRTSILWDAADYYQVVQNHLSQELRAGRIPFWTPYPWGGYPFLADPQVGAWYPLNWPFFLAGVSPRTLVVEHWLHALIACFGAYYLALRLTRRPPAATFAALAYGLSGFFVGHSSHTTMLQGAAWTPWLILLLDRAVESRALRHAILGGLAAGMMILAGHFQTILYSFFAVGLWAVALTLRQPRRWARTMGIALAIPSIGTAISAIATGPGLELALSSVRASLAAINLREGMIPPAALATLVYPNFYGVLDSDYRGPQDVTQYYFYAGILLLPLAIYGLRRAEHRWAGILLVLVPIWYAMGHQAGLYLLVARLPGFGSVRAPVNIWFVPSLGLALLAAMGLALAMERWKAAWIPAAVLAVTVVDLIYFQSAANPLAYSRESYAGKYAAGEQLFRRAVVMSMPTLTRFDGQENLPSFGPMSHFFSSRTEVTYGYGPMPLARYRPYVEAMKTNPKLRNGLNVSLWLDTSNGSVRANPDALPRVNVPKSVVSVPTATASLARLVTLDQSREAVTENLPVDSQDASGAARVSEYAPGHYRIHYRVASPSLLRVGSSYFNGWTARAGGRDLQVVPVDHALMGVVVPAGEGDVELDYRSAYFKTGAVVSLLALAACGGLLAWRRSA